MLVHIIGCALFIICNYKLADNRHEQIFQDNQSKIIPCNVKHTSNIKHMVTICFLNAETGTYIEVNDTVKNIEGAIIHHSISTQPRQ